MDSLERLTPNITVLPRNHISRIVWEVSVSVCLTTMLSSIATFFVATLQLFFALKVAKSNPGSTTMWVFRRLLINRKHFRALRYLEDGKLIRLPTFFIFFFTILLFLLSNVAAMILIPTPLGILPRGVACAFGITLSVFCAAAALHSLHSLFRLDDMSPTGRNGAFSPAALKSQQHYSTLV